MRDRGHRDRERDREKGMWCQVRSKSEARATAVATTRARAAAMSRARARARVRGIQTLMGTPGRRALLLWRVLVACKWIDCSRGGVGVRVQVRVRAAQRCAAWVLFGASWEMGSVRGSGTFFPARTQKVQPSQLVAFGTS